MSFSSVGLTSSATGGFSLNNCLPIVDEFRTLSDYIFVDFDLSGLRNLKININSTIKAAK